MTGGFGHQHCYVASNGKSVGDLVKFVEFSGVYLTSIVLGPGMAALCLQSLSYCSSWGWGCVGGYRGCIGVSQGPGTAIFILLGT